MDEESINVDWSEPGKSVPAPKLLPYECAWCHMKISVNRIDALEHIRLCEYRPENILRKCLEWYASAEEGPLTRDHGRRARKALKDYVKIMGEGGYVVQPTSKI